MLKLVFKQLLKKNYILQTTVFFLFFLIIYIVLDYLNMPYKAMGNEYGILLVIINIFLNIIMAFIASLMISLSTANAKLKNEKESVVSNAPFFSVLFGVLTYGCTSCVISFFASIGIAFSVMALPFAGLPYKIIGLLILILTYYILIQHIKKGVCKIK